MKMWKDNLRGIYFITLKDMKTYYLKPPTVSWGIIFPVTWVLAFYLRNPQNFEELVPGLIAMTVIFSTTAAEAVVINLELRLRSLERLLLAPVSLPSVLLGKVLGGFLFGLIMAVIITAGSALFLDVHINVLYFLLILIPSLLVFTSLGALICVMVKEVFEAQTLLNLPRFLMIFLCGVIYPVSAMPQVLQYIAYFLPLTYTVDGFRQALGTSGSIPVIVDILVLIVFIPLLILPAIKLLAKKFE